MSALQEPASEVGYVNVLENTVRRARRSVRVEQSELKEKEKFERGIDGYRNF